ncbi:WD40 repeat domain-containing protein [Candidatus Bipolaricaulota bacterium]
MNARNPMWRFMISTIVCCLALSLCVVCSGQEVPEARASLSAGGGTGTVSFSPNGELVALACSNGTVKVFSTETWELAWETLVHENNKVFWVVFAPDGTFVAVSIAGELDVIFLDAGSGREVRRLVLPDEWSPGKTFSGVGAMVFSPDGTLLACADPGYGCVMLVDVATGRELGTPIVHASGTGYVFPAFSPDGRLLASAGPDKKIIVWNVETEEEVVTLRTIGLGGLDSLAFSPDGNVLAAAGGNSAAVLLWDTATWETTRLTASSKSVQVGALAFSPDGRLLACGYNDVKIWDADTLELLSTTSIHPAGSVWLQFSPDSEVLAISGGRRRNAPIPSGTVEVWLVSDLLEE